MFHSWLHAARTFREQYARSLIECALLKSVGTLLVLGTDASLFNQRHFKEGRHNSKVGRLGPVERHIGFISAETKKKSKMSYSLNVLFCIGARRAEEGELSARIPTAHTRSTTELDSRLLQLPMSFSP